MGVVQEESATRVGYFEAGKPISDLRIFDRQMWLGAACLRVGGIGDVGTHERSRNQGLARKVVQAAVEWMSPRYDLSLLFGIPGFYEKFGYISCIPEYRATISLADTQGARERLRSRCFVPEDLEAMLGLHRRRFDGSSGGMVRDPAWYDPPRRACGYGRRGKIRMVLNGSGAPVGYVSYDDLPLQVNVAEVVGEGSAVHETILSLLASAARARGLAGIELHLPPGDPFMLFARRYGYTSTISYPRDRGGMVRICNLRGTLEALLPELERLWPAEAPGLMVETDMGTLGVARRNGRLGIMEEAGQALPRIKLPQSLLTALIFGYRGFAEIAERPDFVMSAGAREVAEALFPLREMFIAGPDRF